MVDDESSLSRQIERSVTTQNVRAGNDAQRQGAMPMPRDWYGISTSILLGNAESVARDEGLAHPTARI
jgi:hypothetical protein